MDTGTITSALTVVATPLAVIAIVTQIGQLKIASNYKFAIVVVVGLAFGAAYTLWGSIDLFRNMMTFLLLALSGAGMVDLKKIKAKATKAAKDLAG